MGMVLFGWTVFATWMVMANHCYPTDQRMTKGCFGQTQTTGVTLQNLETWVDRSPMARWMILERQIQSLGGKVGGPS